MEQYKFEFGNEKRLCGKYHKVKKLWEGISLKEQVLATELETWAQTNKDLQGKFLYTLDRIKRAIKGGFYNSKIAVKLWQIYIDDCVKAFSQTLTKQNKDYPSKWRELFKKEARQGIAQDFADYYYDRIKAGEYGEI